MSKFVVAFALLLMSSFNCFAEPRQLFEAVATKQYLSVKHMLQTGESANVRSPSEITPIFVAVVENDLKMVELLFDHGADVNALDPLKRSVLQIASALGRVDICKFLIARGANANYAIPVLNESVLHTAVMGRHQKVVQLLLESGADKRKRIDVGVGLTAEELARQRGEPEIAILIQNWPLN